MDEVMTPYEKDIQEAACAPLPWEELRGRNLLITGATGLIGSCLVDLLMAVSHLYDIPINLYAMGRSRIKAEKRFGSYFKRSDFHFIEQDVVEPINGEIPYHFIIHAASSASPQLYRSAPVEVMKANIFGLSNLLDYGMSHGMKRLLYVSSGEVYGSQQAMALEESAYGYVDILDSRSCYPSSKRAAETLAVSYAKEYDVDVVIARPCHTFGPYFTESDQRAYAQFIRNVEDGQDIVLRSDGTQYRSWCYVVDCASALCYILLKGEMAKAYNIADRNCESSLRNLASTIAGLGGCQLQTGLPDASSGQRVVFDASLLHGLGWKTTGTLKDKLKHTIESRQSLKDEKNRIA